MRKMIGVVALLTGVVAMIAGVVVGQSGIHIEGNILGTFSPVTAILFYGGATVGFFGFAAAMVAPQRKVG